MRILFSEAANGGTLLLRELGRELGKEERIMGGERAGKDAIYPVVRLPSIHQQRWNWQPQSTQGEILGSSCMAGI